MLLPCWLCCTAADGPIGAPASKVFGWCVIQASGSKAAAAASLLRLPMLLLSRPPACMDLYRVYKQKWVYFEATGAYKRIMTNFKILWHLRDFYRELKIIILCFYATSGHCPTIFYIENCVYTTYTCLLRTHPCFYNIRTSYIEYRLPL